MNPKPLLVGILRQWMGLTREQPLALAAQAGLELGCDEDAPEQSQSHRAA